MESVSDPSAARRTVEPMTSPMAGGGNLGAIQAGMLRALSEHKIRPDLILGCSVGAINGAAFATDPTLAGARLLETRWRNVTAEAVMPPGRLPGAVQLVRKGESIHPNQGLRELIESFLGGKSRFEDLSTRFECVATDMAASAEKWFNSGSLIEPLLASAALLRSARGFSRSTRDVDSTTDRGGADRLLDRPQLSFRQRSQRHSRWCPSRRHVA